MGKLRAGAARLGVVAEIFNEASDPRAIAHSTGRSWKIDIRGGHNQATRAFQGTVASRPKKIVELLSQLDD
jgi:hypothetical protein